MRIHLTKHERNQLYEVADIEHNHVVKGILGSRPGPVTVTGRYDILAVRDLAGRAVESKVPERHGFDRIEGIYEMASEEAF